MFCHHDTTTDVYVSLTLRHRHKPRFQHLSFLEGASLCMGRERMNGQQQLLIRKTEDWSMVAKLDESAGRWWPRGEHCDGLIRERANCIEMWCSEGKKRYGTLRRRYSEYVWSDDADQLVTVTAEGLVRVWEWKVGTKLRQFRVSRGHIPASLLEVQQGILSVGMDGEDGEETKILRYLNGEDLPQPLAQKLSNHSGWITFSNGTHVIESGDQFEIVTTKGLVQGTFSHQFGRLRFPFLDEFIVTASPSFLYPILGASEMKIWSDRGDEVFSHRFDCGPQGIVQDEQGRIIAFSTSKQGLSGVTMFDFTARRELLVPLHQQYSRRV